MKKNFIKTLGLGLVFTSVFAVTGCNVDNTSKLETQLDSITQTLEETRSELADLKQQLDKDQMGDILLMAYKNFFLNSNGSRDNLKMVYSGVENDDITFHLYNADGGNKYLLQTAENESDLSLVYEVYSQIEDTTTLYNFYKSQEGDRSREVSSWNGFEELFLLRFGQRFDVNEIKNRIVDYKLLENGNYQITTIENKSSEDFKLSYLEVNTIEIDENYRFVKVEIESTELEGDFSDFHNLLEKTTVTLYHGGANIDLIEEAFELAEDTAVTPNN